MPHLNQVKLDIAFFGWEEDTIHYVYSPALDLTGYGHSKEEAKQSFEDILEEFIRYTHTKKTIFKELENLGWAVNKRKKKIIAPDFEELLTDNEHFNDLYKTKSLIRETSSINLELA
jgi:hypothetical protein